MIKHVEITVGNLQGPPGKWIGGHAIRVNIIKRFKKLQLPNYRKFEIVLDQGLTNDSFVDYEEKNSIRVVALNDFNSIPNCTDIQDVSRLYKMIFESFSIIWQKKGWDENRLIQIHEEIIKENYVVIAGYGKTAHSLNKKIKAELYCQLFSEYADFYLRVNEKKKEKKEIFFFKGYLDPAFFFSFFNSLYWKENDYVILSDFNKRVFFVFNVADDSFKIEYSSIHSSLQDNENFLNAFKFDTPDLERSLLLGIPYS